MKHLTQEDLYFLVKLVNQQDENVGLVVDLAGLVRSQDRAFKSLPAESVDEAAKHTVPIENVRRRLKLLRTRLIAELQSIS